VLPVPEELPSPDPYEVVDEVELELGYEFWLLLDDEP
jgi:hypothetical protein